MAETTATPKKKAPAAKGAGKKTCSVEGCKRGYRAKGLCFFHYKKWRRGELEKKPGLRAARYDTCGKEGCKKKVVGHGLCQEHFDAWKASRKSAKLAGAPAAEAAPAAAS
jgi:hypothetical protein